MNKLLSLFFSLLLVSCGGGDSSAPIGQPSAEMIEWAHYWENIPVDNIPIVIDDGFIKGGPVDSTGPF